MYELVFSMKMSRAHRVSAFFIVTVFPFVRKTQECTKSNWTGTGLDWTHEHKIETRSGEFACVKSQVLFCQRRTMDIDIKSFQVQRHSQVLGWAMYTLPLC